MFFALISIFEGAKCTIFLIFFEKKRPIRIFF
jgi:hypothetical protein